MYVTSQEATGLLEIAHKEILAHEHKDLSRWTFYVTTLDTTRLSSAGAVSRDVVCPHYEGLSSHKNKKDAEWWWRENPKVLSSGEKANHRQYAPIYLKKHTPNLPM